MFGAIGGSLGGGIYGFLNEQIGDDKEELVKIICGATGVIGGISIDVIVGIAAVVVGALIVAHVIPLPMALGTALIAGGGLYMLLGVSCGTGAFPLLGGAIAGECVKK